MSGSAIRSKQWIGRSVTIGPVAGLAASLLSEDLPMSCQPLGPIYLDGGGSQTPFLEDVLGRRLIHGPPENPYGIAGFCTESSYLAASFSSLWALAVVLLAFVAGMTFRFRRRVALWMLALGAVFSMFHFLFRFATELDRRPEVVKDLMWGHLAGQLLSNGIFQMGIPFVVGLILALIFRWIIALLEMTATVVGH
jgi:hypothetical protein